MKLESVIELTYFGVQILGVIIRYFIHI